MGYELRRRLRDLLPTDLGPSERLVGLEIADDANDETRLSFISLEELGRRTGMTPKAVSDKLRKLSLAGWEMRVVLGHDSLGRPVFAHAGKKTNYRVPEERATPRGAFEPCRAREEAPPDVALSESGPADRGPVAPRDVAQRPTIPGGMAPPDVAPSPQVPSPISSTISSGDVAVGGGSGGRAAEPPTVALAPAPAVAHEKEPLSTRDVHSGQTNGRVPVHLGATPAVELQDRLAAQSVPQGRTRVPVPVSQPQKPALHPYQPDRYGAACEVCGFPEANRSRHPRAA